jgi:hypothetical protein
MVKDRPTAEAYNQVGRERGSLFSGQLTPGVPVFKPQGGHHEKNTEDRGIGADGHHTSWGDFYPYLPAETV